MGSIPTASTILPSTTRLSGKVPGATSVPHVLPFLWGGHTLNSCSPFGHFYFESRRTGVFRRGQSPSLSRSSPSLGSAAAAIFFLHSQGLLPKPKDEGVQRREDDLGGAAAKRSSCCSGEHMPYSVIPPHFPLAVAWHCPEYSTDTLNPGPKTWALTYGIDPSVLSRS